MYISINLTVCLHCISLNFSLHVHVNSCFFTWFSRYKIQYINYHLSGFLAEITVFALRLFAEVDLARRKWSELRCLSTFFQSIRKHFFFKMCTAKADICMKLFCVVLDKIFSSAIDNPFFRPINKMSKTHHRH